MGRSKEFHGMTYTSEYRIWKEMIQRTIKVTHKSYKNYGGRGISVCPEWKNSFARFYADMGRRPSSGHSIERLDVNGNYEPNNCTWALSSVQNHNKRPRTASGVVGIYKDPNSWRFEIKLREKRIRKRGFKTIHEAIEARKSAEKLLYQTN